MATRTNRLLLEVLMALMVVFWAANYSLVKVVLAELPPKAFNALRLVIASAVYLALLRWRPAAGGPFGRARGILAADVRITGADWLRLAMLGIVGHFVYQMFFIEGLARTSVANSALIVGSTPVVIGFLSAAVGHERVARPHWIGAALSLAGLYLVAGRGVRIGGASLRGDLLILGAVGSWAVYTVFARPLLARLSPLVVNAWTMVVGALLYVPAAVPQLAGVDWGRVSWQAWTLTALSAVLALNLAYLIWYTSVQRVGASRTSMYSNLVPVVAMTLAWLVLDEPVTRTKVAGAALILSGVLLTRLTGRRRAPDPPAEE